MVNDEKEIEKDDRSVLWLITMLQKYERTVLKLAFLREKLEK